MGDPSMVLVILAFSKLLQNPKSPSLTTVEEDIVGLEVAVHDVVLIEDLEGVDELPEDE
jgi:hypothetical protein